MYAIIRTGGKQYKVEAGDEILVEKLDLEAGAEVCFEVLMLCDGENVTIGKPVVEGASVKATVLSHGRSDKVRIFKFRRRKHSMKSGGHRQNYTELKIEAINA